MKDLLNTRRRQSKIQLYQKMMEHLLVLRMKVQIKRAVKSKVLLVSDSLLHKLDVKRFFVKGSETVKLAKSGDTVNGTSERP